MTNEQLTAEEKALVDNLEVMPTGPEPGRPQIAFDPYNEAHFKRAQQHLDEAATRLLVVRRVGRYVHVKGRTSDLHLVAALCEMGHYVRAILNGQTVQRRPSTGEEKQWRF
jgi:hypothetical protein